MEKRSKRQKKLDRQRIPDRETRVKIIKAMMHGNPKEFLLQLYCKAFQLIPRAAINDLKRLGVTFTEDEIASFSSSKTKAESIPPSRKKDESIPQDAFVDGAYGQELGWDETYAFIAGFTSGGAAYGTRWEEQDDAEYDDLPF